MQRVSYDDGRVYINERQYFGNVPVEAWGLHIGGHRPAYKWLQERKGALLDDDDLAHYQKIIGVLAETGRIMTAIG